MLEKSRVISQSTQERYGSLALLGWVRVKYVSFYRTLSALTYSCDCFRSPSIVVVISACRPGTITSSTICWRAASEELRELFHLDGSAKDYLYLSGGNVRA